FSNDDHDGESDSKIQCCAWPPDWNFDDPNFGPLQDACYRSLLLHDRCYQIMTEYYVDDTALLNNTYIGRSLENIFSSLLATDYFCLPGVDYGNINKHVWDEAWLISDPGMIPSVEYF